MDILPDSVAVNIIVLVVTFAVLAKGADWLVDGLPELLRLDWD